MSYKALLPLAALFLVGCSGISDKPVKSIDIYAKPYYYAQSGNVQMVTVNKDIDALLMENKVAAFEKAQSMIEAKPEFVSPMTLFTLAARAYDFGQRDRAVAWYYRGQNRLITALSVLELPKQSIIDNTGFGQLIGRYINPYAYCDLGKQRQAAEDAYQWTLAHPYEVIFLKEIPAKQTDRKAALKEAENQLKVRLTEQDKYFANPENKAKWQKERQENLVNQRFCW